jgi:hypothetical protein
MMIAIDPANVGAMRATAFRPVHLTGAAYVRVRVRASSRARRRRRGRAGRRGSGPARGRRRRSEASPTVWRSRWPTTSNGRAEHPGVRYVLGSSQSVCVARLTAQQKVERDARIVADRAAGLTWPTIARRHDLSERQCQEIVKAHRATWPLLESHDPIDAITELVEQLDSIVEKFAIVAEETKHDAVKVGALRSQLAAMEQRFTVAHALGLVPTLDLVRRDTDLRQVMPVAADVLTQHEVSDEAVDDLLVALDAGLAWPHGNGHGAQSRS